MAKIITRYTLGDTIEFIDPDGNYITETVRMIETQLVEGFGLWIIYGFGDDIYNPSHVSEHQILISQQKVHERRKAGNTRRLSRHGK